MVVGMLPELDCMWHFAEMGENAGDEGPNSAMSQTFAQFPCKALVRESIQNSLDAVLDEKKAVVVCFEHGRISKYNYPGFFGISKHIQACREYYSGNKSANAIYPAMLDNLNASSDYVGYIKVTDQNTKGMDYEGAATDKSFYAFVRAAGVSVKPAEGAGGSFGFGKGAFFVMSPLNTLMVSTWNKEGKTFFEGVTRLCSHKVDGVKRSHMGFYDNNGGLPIEDQSRIPTAFKRQEPGTSISIMGIEWENWLESKDDLVKEVLANFFVAILRGKLEVYVDGNPTSCGNAIVINAQTIGDLMKKYFPSYKDVNRKNKFNPRPYYEAMTDSDSLCFEKELPTLGKVELHLKEFEGNVTQIIFMRKLLMKVFRERHSLGNYNGVFICDNSIGNKILGDMEDPEHKSWDKEQCQKTDIETSYETACCAEEEINKFINEVLDELLNIGTTESVQISGLEKYLPSSDGVKGKGEKGNPFTGRPTGNYIKEGVSRTTEGQLEEPQKLTKRGRGQVVEISEGNFKKDADGDDVGGTNPDPNSGNGGGGSSPGDAFGRGEVDDTHSGKYYRLIDVEWRPVLNAKTGTTDIIIYPPKDINDAVLKFEIGRESSSGKAAKEDVSIVKTNKGECDGLSISGFKLTGKARNVIQIKFSDKMYHTLKLAVYEVD